MSQCKGCGREILFLRSMNSGGTIPLEICRNAYRISPTKDLAGDLLVEQIKGEVVYISHFLTCKRANDFSASRRKEEPT